MIRKLIVAVMAILAVVAMAVPASAGSRHIRPQLVAPRSHARVTLACGYLRDHSGSGLAASAFPGQSTSSIPGTVVTTEGSGAWKVCYNTDDKALFLASDSGECFANDSTSGSDTDLFYACNDDRNQTFTESTGRGLQFTNAATGGLLCSTGGFGNYGADVIDGGSGCTSYNWNFESTSPTGAKATDTVFARPLPRFMRCGFTSPVYDYNTNAAGNKPPAWGAVWWPLNANTCGDWVNAHAIFSNGQNAYGPHETHTEAVSKAIGPLSNSVYLTRLYMVVGHAGTNHRCVARVYRTVSAWHCS